MAMRFLFVGNSITTAPVNSAIGWDRTCGMAASCAEKDYVHMAMERITRRFPESTFEILDASEYEKNYNSFDLTEYEPYRDFEADVIVMRIIENVNPDDIAQNSFGRHYERIINYLNKRGAIIICTGSFWRNDDGDAIIKRISVRNGYTFIPLSQLDTPEYRADGEFIDPGVAAHPSDEGMQEIAALIAEEVERRFS